MEYGVSLGGSAHHWKVVKRAEELRFTHTWLFDAPIVNARVFVALAAAPAMQTSKIKLAPNTMRPGASALSDARALAASGAIRFERKHATPG